MRGRQESRTGFAHPKRRRSSHNSRASHRTRDSQRHSVSISNRLLKVGVSIRLFTSPNLNPNLAFLLFPSSTPGTFNQSKMDVGGDLIWAMIVKRKYSHKLRAVIFVWSSDILEIPSSRRVFPVGSSLPAEDACETARSAIFVDIWRMGSVHKAPI